MMMMGVLRPKLPFLIIIYLCGFLCKPGIGIPFFNVRLDLLSSSPQTPQSQPKFLSPHPHQDVEVHSTNSLHENEVIPYHHHHQNGDVQQAYEYETQQKPLLNGLTFSLILSPFLQLSKQIRQLLFPQKNGYHSHPNNEIITDDGTQYRALIHSLPPEFQELQEEEQEQPDNTNLVPIAVYNQQKFKQNTKHLVSTSRNHSNTYNSSAGSGSVYAPSLDHEKYQVPHQDDSQDDSNSTSPLSSSVYAPGMTHQYYSLSKDSLFFKNLLDSKRNSSNSSK